MTQDERSKRLQDAATKFLRRRGCTWSGKSKEQVDVEQCEFEQNRIKPSGHGGYSRKKR